MSLFQTFTGLGFGALALTWKRSFLA